MSEPAQTAGFDWQQTFFPGVFKLDTHPALVAARAERARLGAERERAVQEDYGQDIRKMLGYGLAAGAGATALYHALRALRRPRRRDQRSLELTTGAPMVAKQAALGLPNIDISKIDKAIGGNLPRGWLPQGPSFSGGADSGQRPADPYLFRPSWGAIAALAAGGLGAYGGNRLVNYLVKNQHEKDNKDEIEEAQREYFEALRGDSKEAQALDATYARLLEKKANPTPDVPQTSNVVQQALAGLGNAATSSLQHAHGIGLGALLLSGLYGGKLVYDWTRDRTAGDNLAKAQASRARMSGLPTVWIDPDELTRVKEIATAQPNE